MRVLTRCFVRYIVRVPGEETHDPRDGDSPVRFVRFAIRRVHGGAWGRVTARAEPVPGISL